MKNMRAINKNSVGISGLGYYSPKDVMTAEEIASLSGIPVHVFSEKIGIEKKHIAGPEEHPTDMGAIAAKIALEKADVDPKNIQIIIFCGLGYYEYQFWSPAAKIQHLIGADNAFAFEVKNGCNGGNLGLEIAKELLLGNSTYQNALVICSEKLSIAVNYKDPNAISSFTFADGAAAAVVSKDCKTNQLLSYASITDGSLVDYVKVPYGGTVYPLISPITNEKDRYFQVSDPEGLDRIFATNYLQNYQRVIIEALQKSGFTSTDIDYLFTNQVKTSISEGIRNIFNLQKNQTIITLKDFGHQGTVDTFFCLTYATDAGIIKPGDLVVLASSAIGFSWAASVIKYSE
jgi:3-oxoacyl-[acyl-carrier-protein] synthase III